MKNADGNTHTTGFYGTDIPASYFEDEVRDGFFVSGMMKHFWAAQLAVLREVDAVCKTLGIPWFPDSGTLLGAARHKGYIPWDDDLDIILFRHDLDLFAKEALSLLPEGYLVNDFRRDPSYKNTIIRVQNSDSIHLHPEHLAAFAGCPYVAGVDLFALDGVYEDGEKEAERRKRFRDTFLAAAYVSQGMQASEDCNRLLDRIETENGIRLIREENLHHDLLSLQLRIAREVPSYDAKQVGNYYNADHIWTFPATWFDSMITLPFEHALLPAPVAYREILQTYFGNWKHPLRIRSDHDYPVWARQERKLKKNIGGYPFRYTMKGARQDA